MTKIRPGPGIPSFPIFTSLLLVACLTLPARGQEPPPIRWATSVLGFSSQYGSPSYAAGQTRGEPDVFPDYDDSAKAWAARLADAQREYLILGYSDPQPAAAVAIYETYNPGAVDKVEVRDAATGEWVEVWTGVAAVQPEEARIFLVPFEKTAFAVDAVRLELDCPSVPGWNEIDAVALLSVDAGAVGPEIGSFTVTSGETDSLFTELGPETVTGRVRLIDYLSGVAGAELQLIDATGAAVGPPSPLTRVNAFGSSVYRDEWTGSLVVPQGTATGLYGVRIRASSLTGGGSVVDTPGLLGVTGTLPRPPRYFAFTKLMERGERGHATATFQYSVRQFVLPPLINARGEVAFEVVLTNQSGAGSVGAGGGGATLYRWSPAGLEVLADVAVTGYYNDYASASPPPISFNDEGWVAFRGWPQGGGNPKGIYIANGDETLEIDTASTTVTTLQQLQHPKINNARQVAYTKYDLENFKFDLWRGDGASRLRLIEGEVPRGFSFSDGLPLPLVVSGELPVLENLAAGGIADNGTVIFSGSLRVPGTSASQVPRYMVIGQARPDGVGFLKRASTFTPRITFYQTVGSPTVSRRGQVAYTAYADPQGGFALPPPELGIDYLIAPTHFIGSARGHRASLAASVGGFFSLSINDRGAVSYLQSRGSEVQLRVTALPSDRNTILRRNHYLNGRRVEQIRLSQQAINNRGQIALLVRFKDGHEAIYRADPLSGDESALPLPPDEETTGPAEGVVRYTFHEAGSARWLELPPRGEITLRVLTAGGRIRELAGISEGLARPVQVIVNQTVTRQWNIGESFDLIESAGAAAATVTLRDLAVSEGFNGPLALQTVFNNPTVELEIEGAAVPLLRQPATRAVLPGALLSLPATALEEAGFAYRWSRNGVNLEDHERWAGSATDTLTLYPFDSADAGSYRLSASGAGGSGQVAVEVLTAVTFANWIAGHFPEALDHPEFAAPDAMPQDDGVSNLVKYALGIDPTRPMTVDERERFARVSRAVPGAETRLEISVTLNPAAIDVGIVLQSSADPGAGSWEPLPPEDLVVRESLDARGRTMSVLLPATADAGRFYRLAIAYVPAA